MTTVTKNFDLLQTQVAEHIAADAIIQGEYWDGSHGCFIGCLSHSDNPMIAVVKFGLTLPLLRIAEGIFEGLPATEAKAFFGALPDAIGRDGKDLSKVHWQFLAAELRSLPKQRPEIKVVIDPVIAGMDLLANGEIWSRNDAAYAAAAADAASYAAAADAASYAAAAARRDLLLTLISEAV